MKIKVFVIKTINSLNQKSLKNLMLKGNVKVFLLINSTHLHTKLKIIFHLPSQNIYFLIVTW